MVDVITQHDGGAPIGYGARQKWSGVRSSRSTSHAVGAEFERLRVCYGGVLLKGCSHSHDSLRPYRTIRSQGVTVLSSTPVVSLRSDSHITAASPITVALSASPEVRRSRRSCPAARPASREQMLFFGWLCSEEREGVILGERRRPSIARAGASSSCPFPSRVWCERRASCSPSARRRG